jgi:PPOX class probable F420-dependent enzyme
MVRELLLGKNFAFVATINKDGSPQLSPTWVDTDGEHILINTEAKRAKVRNLRRDPRIVISLIENSNPYNGIVIRGRVVEQIEGKAANDHIDRLNKKYKGVDIFPNKGPGVVRVIVKIRPEKIIHVS